MASVVKPKVAFVTGGNGITGSAIIEYLAENTTKEEWSDIIVTSRSPTVFQSGAKVHIRPVPSPASEDASRLVSSTQNFYYPQEDFLAEKQKESKWNWTVIRPEAIIGHTSKPNGMNSPLTYALCILVQKELGQPAPMPTNQIYWDGVDDCSDASLIADLTVWASTTPKAANQAFNAVDDDYIQWRYMWPHIAAYLGAEASPEAKFHKPRPEEGALQQEFSFSEWAKDKQQVWDRLCEEAGVPEAKATRAAGTWAFQDWVFQRAWCSTLSFNKAREFGYTGFRDSYKSITGAFENFRQCR